MNDNIVALLQVKDKKIFHTAQNYSKLPVRPWTDLIEQRKNQDWRTNPLFDSTSETNDTGNTQASIQPDGLGR